MRQLDFGNLAAFCYHGYTGSPRHTASSLKVLHQANVERMRACHIRKSKLFVAEAPGQSSVERGARQLPSASRPGKEARAAAPSSPSRMHRGWYSAHVVTDVLPLEASLLMEAVQALPRLQSLCIQLARVRL